MTSHQPTSQCDRDHGLSGQYKSELIVENAADTATVIGKAAQYIKLNVNKLPDGDAKTQIKAGVFKAIQGVARARMDSKINDLIKDFSGNGFTWKDKDGNKHTTKLTIATQPIPLYDGAPDGNTVLDAN